MYLRYALGFLSALTIGIVVFSVQPIAERETVFHGLLGFVGTNTSFGMNTSFPASPPAMPSTSSFSSSSACPIVCTPNSALLQFISLGLIGPQTCQPVCSFSSSSAGVGTTGGPGGTGGGTGFDTGGFGGIGGSLTSTTPVSTGFSASSRTSTALPVSTSRASIPVSSAAPLGTCCPDPAKLGGTCRIVPRSQCFPDDPFHPDTWNPTPNQCALCPKLPSSSASSTKMVACCLYDRESTLNGTYTVIKCEKRNQTTTSTTICHSIGEKGPDGKDVWGDWRPDLNNNCTVDACSKGKIDLILKKVLTTPVPIVVGQNVSYKLTVTNNGSAPAVDVTINDFANANLEFVGPNPPCRVLGLSGSISCDMGIISPGDDKDITLTFKLKPRVSNECTVRNTALVYADNKDSNLSNNYSYADFNAYCAGNKYCCAAGATACTQVALVNGKCPTFKTGTSETGYDTESTCNAQCKGTSSAPPGGSCCVLGERTDWKPGDLIGRYGPACFKNMTKTACDAKLNTIFLALPYNYKAVKVHYLDNQQCTSAECGEFVSAQACCNNGCTEMTPYECKQGGGVPQAAIKCSTNTCKASASKSASPKSSSPASSSKAPTNDLSIKKALLGATGPRQIGSEVTYEITVTNHSASETATANLTDNPPAGLVLKTMPANCTNAAGFITCPNLSLPPGDTKITLVFTIPDPRPCTIQRYVGANAARISALPIYNNNTGNDTASTPGLTIPCPTWEVKKEMVTSGPFRKGQTVTFKLTFTAKNGDYRGPASNGDKDYFTDFGSAGMKFPDQGGCKVHTSGEQIQCDLPPTNKDSVHTVTLQAVLDLVVCNATAQKKPFQNVVIVNRGRGIDPVSDIDIATDTYSGEIDCVYSPARYCCSKADATKCVERKGADDCATTTDYPASPVNCGGACGPKTIACCTTSKTCNARTGTSCPSGETPVTGNPATCPATNPCGVSPPKGACCRLPSRGGCAILTEAECKSNPSGPGGPIDTWKGAGTTCAKDCTIWCCNKNAANKCGLTVAWPSGLPNYGCPAGTNGIYATAEGCNLNCGATKQYCCSDKQCKEKTAGVTCDAGATVGTDATCGGPGKCDPPKTYCCSDKACKEKTAGVTCDAGATVGTDATCGNKCAPAKVWCCKRDGDIADTFSCKQSDDDTCFLPEPGTSLKGYPTQGACESAAGPCKKEPTKEAGCCLKDFEGVFSCTTTLDRTQCEARVGQAGKWLDPCNPTTCTGEGDVAGDTGGFDTGGDDGGVGGGSSAPPKQLYCCSNTLTGKACQKIGGITCDSGTLTEDPGCNGKCAPPQPVVCRPCPKATSIAQCPAINGCVWTPSMFSTIAMFFGQPGGICEPTPACKSGGGTSASAASTASSKSTGTTGGIGGGTSKSSLSSSFSSSVSSRQFRLSILGIPVPYQCGDGIVSPDLGEECEPGLLNVNGQDCNFNCTWTACTDRKDNDGDGYTDDKDGGCFESGKVPLTVAQGFFSRLVGQLFGQRSGKQGFLPKKNSESCPSGMTDGEKGSCVSLKCPESGTRSNATLLHLSCVALCKKGDVRNQDRCIASCTCGCRPDGTKGKSDAVGACMDECALTGATANCRALCIGQTCPASL